MLIKGTSLTSTNNFVKETFPERYQEWLKSLPAESNKIFSDLILSSHWFNSQDGLIIPTQIIAKLFYNDNVSKASFEVGKFSARTGLTGIYNIFIKIASPAYILKRASLMFNTYYSETTFEVVEAEKNYAKMNIRGFKNDESLIFDRTEGWMKQLGEIIHVKFDIIKEINTNGEKAECTILSKW